MIPLPTRKRKRPKDPVIMEDQTEKKIEDGNRHAAPCACPSKQRLGFTLHVSQKFGHTARKEGQRTQKKGHSGPSLQILNSNSAIPCPRSLILVHLRIPKIGPIEFRIRTPISLHIPRVPTPPAFRELSNPKALKLKSSTLDQTSSTLNSKSQVLNPNSQNPEPKSSTLNSKSWALNPKP